jgi:hypothetical protein
MRQNRMSTALGLLLVGLLAAACGSPSNPTPSESNRVATRVAEEVAVAATLTALAPAGKQSVSPTTTTPAQVASAPPTQAAEPPKVPSPTEAATPPSAMQPPVSTETPTQAPPAVSCRVISAGLNLRPGPGTVYAPPLAGLARDTEVLPLSFVARGFPTGQWIEVKVTAIGRVGWVSAGQQFVACNVQLASLPAGVPPPTPTPAPTSTLLPPTAIPIVPPATQPPTVQVVIIPVDGSDGNKALGNNRGVNSGRNLLLPGFTQHETSDPMVFRNKIVFQAEVFDRNVGQYDGAGIDNVTFTIRDETGDIVHERTERNAGYCVFGGGEPDCTVWRFAEHGDKWPSGAELRPGIHDVQIVIQPKNGDGVTWFWSFRIEQ